ncbi:type I-D CRISPR-associated helicase Cas3' [Candidatus Chloroploca sp. Khr17]|uniref:type I-D CRISPR-associated helicase Cas3' n=1 Tax=Candidatus Chloroploca sp. Khr17 TaxID=2496869 RepID=UPI00101D904C|nr:type I-D CRISPR-associated helicase Cas3' [Candidatus Chloroploca sp. Khr17]
MTIHLSAQFEKLAPKEAFGPLPGTQLLYHQLRTAIALEQASLVVNSYNTGTGKTRASLLHLFAINGHHHNVLFIAPTNALIHQHVDDIQAFVTQHNLCFRIIEVNAKVIRSLGVDLAIPDRNGEKLYRLLQNPLEFCRELGISPDDQRNLPFIIVVNPDIFHYMLFFYYGNHDRRNLFIATLQTFWYVVIDEFHYYDEKQLVSFLCFLTFWQEFGYFDQGRKVCILSATPNPQVESYLTTVLGNRWIHVSPDNEVDESGAYQSVQTLSELELEISSSSLDEWLSQHRSQLEQWLQANYDGAIISNSLARINEVFDLLRGLDICRITGPEPSAQRIQALRHQLLLATPVVDIGYNFDRDKPRQNIDFIVCECRYRDELIQRIGRAGRILGKPECYHLSHAVALVSLDVAQSLQIYDGQTLSRRSFRDVLNGLDTLPPKHSLGSYMRIHGMVEAFYPVYKLSQMLSPEQQTEEIERLVERMRSVFAPNNRQGIKSLQIFAYSFEARERWVLAKDSEKWDKNGWHRKTLVANLANYFSQLQSSAGKQISCTPQYAHEFIDAVVNDPTRRAGLNKFILSQYYLTKSLFAFRDSFSGPVAVIYDPDRLFSSQMFNTYDILHLIANYHFHVFADRGDFLRCGNTDLKGDFYIQLQRRRTARLNIEFSLKLEETGLGSIEKSGFERLYCRRPVALCGLKLAAKQKGGDYEPMLPTLREAIYQLYLTLLIVPKDDLGALISSIRNTSIYSIPIDIIFADGSSVLYSAVIGSAVWHADALLRGHFQMRDRQASCDAIIL